MDEKKVKESCKTLTASRDWPIDTEAIEKLWSPIRKDFTLQEKVLLLKCLVQNDSVFRWLHLVSHVLPDVVSEDQNFINLIEIVVDKVKGDMAQGIFIRSLINIGERNPEMGIRLYTQLIDVSNDAVIPYSGLLLGGAAKKEFDKVFKIIKEDLGKRISVKVACLRALRVAFETNGPIQSVPVILNIFERMSLIPDHSIQIEVIRGLIDFDKFDPERCEKRLLEIATKGNSIARFTILDRIWFQSLNTQSKEIEILKICVEDNNVNVLESVARILSRKGQAFLEDSLEIVKRMLKKPVDSFVPDLSYYLKELCKNEPKSCIKTFQKWVESDQDLVFKFRVSRVLPYIQQDNSK